MVQPINRPQFRDPITRQPTVRPVRPQDLPEDRTREQFVPEATTGLRSRLRQQSDLQRAVQRGTGQVASGFESAAGLAAGLALGENEFSDERLAGAEETQRGIQELRSEQDVSRLEDVQSFEDVGELVTNFAGEQVPVLGTVVGAGLVGGLVGGPVGAAAGAFGVAGSLEGGGSFQDLATDPTIRENLSFREISGLSAGVGVLGGIAEAIPALNILNRFGLGRVASTAIKGNLLKRFGKGIAQQAALEGGTEAIQAVIARTAAKIADENREILGEEGVSEILNSFAAGAVVGGGVGGVVGLVTGGSPAQDAQELDTAFNDLVANGARSDDLNQLLLEAPQLSLPAPAQKAVTKFSIEDFDTQDDIANNPLRILADAAQSTGLTTTQGRDMLRLVAQAAESLREQVGTGEATALIANTFIDAGMTAADADQAAQLVMDEGPQQEVAFLDSQLDTQPKKTDEGTEGDLPDVLFVNEKTTHFLRTRKGELGYAPVNPNFADVDTLTQQIEDLQRNDPDSTFSIIPLGDAIATAARAEAIPSDQRTRRDFVAETLDSAADEKSAQLSAEGKSTGLDAIQFPADDPLAYLNQFRAIERVSVPVDQEGLALRDTDIEVDLKSSAVELGGETTTIRQVGDVPPIVTGRTALKRSSDFLAKRTTTKRVRVKQTGAPNQPKSKVETRVSEAVLDAERLTRTMLRKINPSQKPKEALTDEAGQAFTAGLLALVERGDFEINLNTLPDDLVIFTTEEGRPVTFKEIQRTEVGRVRIQFAQLKAEQRKIERDFAVAQELLASAENPQALRNNKLRVARMERRGRDLPNELLQVERVGKEIQGRRAATVPVLQKELETQERIRKQRGRLKKRQENEVLSKVELDALKSALDSLKAQFGDSMRVIQTALRELTDAGINIEPVLAALDQETGERSRLREILVDADAFSQAAALERDTTEPAFSTPADPKASAGTTEAAVIARLLQSRDTLRDTLSIIRSDPFMNTTTMRSIVRRGLQTAGRGVPDNFKTMDKGEMVDFVDLVERRVARDIVDVGRLEEREVRPGAAKETTSFARSDRPELRPELRVGVLRDRNRELQTLFNKWTKELGLPDIRLIGTTEEAMVFAIASEEKAFIDAMLAGKISGFANNEKRVIYVNPRLNGAVAFEIAAHEMGHIVLREKWKTADQKTKEALVNEFIAWREEQMRGPRTVKEIEASRIGRARVLKDILQVSETRELLLNEISVEDANYILDFDEWFADQISRHLSEEAVTDDVLVASFFKDVVASLQKLWELVRSLGAEKYKAAQSVQEFVQQIIRDKDVAYASVRVDMATKLAKEGINEPAGEAGALMALDPYSEATFFALREQLVDPDLLTDEERGVLLRTFYTTKMRRKLREFLDGSPDMQELVDRDPTAAAALGMQLWLSGDLSLTPQANPRIQALYDQLMTTFGLVQGHDQAISIMEALRDNVIMNRKVNNQPWALTRHLRKNRVQDIAASMQVAYEHVAAFIGPHLDSSDGWMFKTGNPALIQLAQKFHARVGTERVGETFFAARGANIGKFSNAWSKIRRTVKTDEDVQAVLAALRNPKATVDPRLKPHVDDTRALLRKLRDYYVSRGLEIGDRGSKYFPLVFDTRTLQEQGDQFKSFLLRPAFKKALDRIASGIQLGEQQKVRDGAEKHFEEIDNAVRNAERRVGRDDPKHPDILAARERQKEQAVRDARSTREEQTEQRMQEISLPTHEEIVEQIYASIIAAEGNADVNLNENRAGATPFMAAMNKRSLQFVFDLGTEQDIKDFGEFQSDNLDFIMFTYIRQGVKRAEYVKRFGNDSSTITDLLAQAQAQGATERELRHANYYVDAMVGTIGSDTNAKLRKLFGRPAPKPGEVIDPSFQKVMSFMMVMQNLAVLSLATLTSLVDPVGILVRTQDLDATAEAFRTGSREVWQSVRNLYDSDKEARTAVRELAEDLGVIEDHMINEALEWEYGSAYITGKLKAVNETFFKAIGLTQWTRLTRVMALAGGKVFIKKHAAALREPRPPESAAKARKRWDLSKRFLEQLNLTPDDVVLDSEGELRILTEQEREPLLADREQPGDSDDVLAAKRLEKARDDRVRAALARMVDESILRPNAAQRPIRASDPHLQLIFHLKSFMWSFHDRILARVASEAGEGNFMPALYLMGFIPAMIAADWLRDMLLYWGGGNPRKKNWGVSDYVWSGTQRSGINGLSQLLIDAQNDRQFGGVGYESFAGPSVEALGEIPDLFLDNNEGQWRAFTRQLPGGNVLRVWNDNVFG